MKDSIYIEITTLTDEELEKLSTEIQKVLNSRKETKKKRSMAQVGCGFGGIPYRVRRY